MVNLFECGLSSAAHENMKRRISELISRKRRAFLIVPEQQTVTVEAEMARELAECAPLYFEVTNFTRLTDTVFRSLGGISREHIDSAKRALLMWKALAELSPTLDLTRGRGEVNEGLVKKALLAVSELESGAIDEEKLFALTENDSIGTRLRRKINDVTLIRTLYKRLVSEKYLGADDALLRCVSALRENAEHFSDTVFFVEGFTSFTEGQLRILSALFLRTEVNVLMPIPRYGRDGFEYTEIRRQLTRIGDLCAKEGAKVSVLSGGAFEDERPAVIEEAIRLIWRNDGEIDNDSLQSSDSFRIFEAHTPFDECDFLAADIKKRVIEGDKYSDFAIIARGTDEYLGVLDVALAKADIPYFMSRTHEISEYEAIKFIYTAYSAAMKFRREDVISYMKCGFADLSRDEADELEIYMERWSLGGAELTRSVPWSMNPDGYTTRQRDDASDELIRINRSKDALIKPLLRFSEQIKTVKTVREHAEILFDFLTEMKLEEKLSKRGRDSVKLFGIIVDALDTISDVLGDMTVSAEVFLSQLKILFSSVEIGRIPTCIDEVTVGGAELLRLSGKKHIYLLGVNQGKFPKNPKDESYFTEKDKAVLKEYVEGFEPELEIKCARELFFFSRAMSFAKDSVTLLYSLCSTDFKPTPKSDVIARISEISGGKIQPRAIDKLSPTERIFSPTPAGEISAVLSSAERRAIDDALCESGSTPYPHDEAAIENGELYLSDSKSLIYNDVLNLTQTRIDSFAKCPLSYFLKYNLKLSDTAPYEVDYSGVGSFIHAILENFFAYTKKENTDLSAITREDTEKITLISAKKYLSLLSGENEFSTKTKILLSRLYRASLPIVEDICDELRGSLFVPEFFELNIRGGKDTPDPVRFKFPEGDVSVYGQIDRVDVYRDGDDVYVKVIDYKTGTKNFSPDDLQKGENLQMFLYLKSIIDSKNRSFRERLGLSDSSRLIPAGVIYIKASVSDTRASHDDTATVLATIKKEQGRQGMLLNDPKALAAQNALYLPIKYKSDGSLYSSSEKFVYTPTGWDELMETVENAVAEISRDMRSGNINAKPKKRKSEKLPCEYCEYKAFCRKQTYGD